MAKKPPPSPASLFGPPAPKKNTGPPGQSATLAAIYKHNPGLSKYNGIIQQAANRWGVTAVDIALVLAIEDPTGDPRARSSVGALGLAQIGDTSVDKSLNPVQYDTFAAQWGADIPDSKKFNPTFAVNYLAWRMSYGIQTYGSLDAWYSASATGGRPRGYNPNYTGPGPSSLLKTVGVAGYQDKLPPSPTDTAGKSTDTAAARAGLKPILDPWVTISKDGKIVTSKNPNPPNGAVTGFGQPVPLSAFLAYWKQTINPVYIAYTGKAATPAQVANILRTGVDPKYTLPRMLSKSKAFVGSPVWNHYAPDYIAAWQAVYGPGSKPDQQLVGRAILNTWSQGAFQAVIRQRPDYLSSEEFKQNATTMTTAYKAIFGTPDVQGLNLIKEATASGWSPDQFQQYLRAQPTYTSSNEYRDQMLNLFSQLGLITGEVPTLVAGQSAPQPPPPTAGSDTLAGAQGSHYGPPGNRQPQYPAAPNSSIVPGTPRRPASDGLTIAPSRA